MTLLFILLLQKNYQRITKVVVKIRGFLLDHLGGEPREGKRDISVGVAEEKNVDGSMKMIKKIFSHQSLNKFTFCVKSSDSIFFLLSASPIVN